MENKIKTAVLVSGGGTNLQALIDFEKSGGLAHGKLSLVISDKAGAYALTRAENADIPSAVVAKKDYPDRDSFESAITAELERFGIELIILAGFMTILSAGFTSRYSGRIINIHPSLIPSFCGKGFYGLKVHEAALSYGVKVTGATVHFVNEVPDGGRIIMQKAVEVQDGDTPEELQARVMREAEWIILPASAEKVCKKLLNERNSG